MVKQNKVPGKGQNNRNEEFGFHENNLFKLHYFALTGVNEIDASVNLEEINFENTWSYSVIGTAVKLTAQFGW